MNAEQLFPSMPAHLRSALNNLLAARPSEWQNEPDTGEVFALKEECKLRLQTYALCLGFAVVTEKSDKRMSTFRCIHHGEETTNKHGLDIKVAKDSNGNIISNRQRNGYCAQKECDWMAFYSFKAVNRGKPLQQWILTVRNLRHLSTMTGLEHPFHTNLSTGKQDGRTRVLIQLWGKWQP